MPSKNFIVLFGLLAAAAAVAFLAISIDHEFYAPGSRAFGDNVDIRALHGYLPPRIDRELTPQRVLRKLYSILAFAIVGFFVSAILEPRRRLVGAAILVGSFSSIIEVVQKLTGATEGLLSNAFDIGCGAVGGLLGAVIWTAASRRFGSSGPPPKTPQ